MQLLYTNSIPIISYAIAIKSFSSCNMSDCNMAINNYIRRIFSYNCWESTRSLRETIGYQSIYEIFANSNKQGHCHKLRALVTENVKTCEKLAKTC